MSDNRFHINSSQSLGELWKPIQLIVINKESTTEANTDEYSKVYDVLNRQIATKFGVSVPFPSRETYETKD